MGTQFHCPHDVRLPDFGEIEVDYHMRALRDRLASPLEYETAQDRATLLLFLKLGYHPIATFPSDAKGVWYSAGEPRDVGEDERGRLVSFLAERPSGSGKALYPRIVRLEYNSEAAAAMLQEIKAKNE